MKTVKNYKCKCGYEGELEIDSNIVLKAANVIDAEDYNPNKDINETTS